MRVLISAEGEHEPAGQHHMVVDGSGVLIDLSAVQGSMVDPTIRRVEWGPNMLEGGAREGGVIVRQDGHRTPFADRGALKPYLAAFEARKAQLEREQVEHDALRDAAWQRAVERVGAVE